MIYMSFFIGLILICKGGDWFVDAASKLSEILGIPKYVIGAYQRRYYLGNDCCNGNIFAGTCNNSYSNPKKRVFFVCRKYYRCKYDRFRFYFTNLYIT